MSVTLDVSTLAGKTIFRRLVQQADILVENQPVGRMGELGFDYQALSSINPGLIMVSITPFGQTGPYSHFKSHYLNTFHAGGEGYLLPGGLGWLLYSDQPPIKAGGFLGEYDSGVASVVAALSAYFWCQNGGTGQHIDISQQEVLLNLVRCEVGRWNTGFIEQRATRLDPIAGLLQCRDGFVGIYPIERHMWDGLMELMGNPEWAKEERYDWATLISPYIADGGEVVTRLEEVNTAIEQWALKHTRDEIYKSVQEKRCVAGMICTPEDLLKSEQLQAREFFVEIDHPIAGKLTYPSAPYKLSKTPWRVLRPAPLLGEHNQEVYCGRLGYTKEQLVRLSQGGII
jgi:crotonobetainyl-CoA:carnitine CoA-transferase CaiB-like acyl-CoA transferase